MAAANDLLQLYHLAQNHDATLQAALAQRDAAIEAKPQALALLLPQVSANASADRLRIGEQLIAPQTVAGTTITGCQIAAGAQNEVCYGDGHGYGLSLSQTLWSFQSFSQLREASATAAAAEANLLAAQQALMLRVARAYFGILGARDTLATSPGRARTPTTPCWTRPGRASRPASGRAAIRSRTRRTSTQTEQQVIDAQNALDDAELLMTEVTGSPATKIAAAARYHSARIARPGLRGGLGRRGLEGQSGGAGRRNCRPKPADRDIDVQRGKGLPSVVLGGRPQPRLAGPHHRRQRRQTIRSGCR